MQEGNPEKWLAQSLRRQQEEHPLPYDPGAWEAFEKKQKTAPFKKRSRWISGIAASIALLLTLAGLWFSTTDQNQPASQSLAVLSGPVSSPEEGKAEQSAPSSASIADQVDAQEQTRKSQPSQTKTQPPGEVISRNKAVVTRRSPAEPTPFLNPKPTPSSENKSEAQSIPQAALAEKTPVFTNKPESSQATRTEEPNPPQQTHTLLPAQPALSEQEIEEILSKKTSPMQFSLGFNPGFGTSQSSGQITSGNSLGLGVLLDLELTSKLSMGSGLAVNYLNQASESQSYPQLAGFASPVVQTSEISQVQMDIPLYIRYPLTSSRSVSVQAGFSNLLTFNQSAEQQTSFTQQVAVPDLNAASANSFTLKTQTVDQLSALAVPQSKFYPFATANLGVNLRLYQSKKTSYEVMPFYNYPLQEFSGYGEKLGLFGASFRVNFGVVERK
jgi:hypothetical protein